jgi:hypothetical protein
LRHLYQHGPDENPVHGWKLLRTEQDMMDLILGVAEQDERVRAVVMNALLRTIGA